MGGFMDRSWVFAGAIAALSIAPQAIAQFGSDERYRPREVTALVDRVHEDLDRAYRAARFSNSDHDRLNGAEKKLRDFAQKWDRGKFDKGELDEAIAGIQHVLDNNHLLGRERDALWSDVNQLRQMREAYDRHEIR
jgi:hypothetical protein